MAIEGKKNLPDWREVTDPLNARAESFCRQFLPNGRREGDYWRTGNILDSSSNGKFGKSFIVYLCGPKCGYWVENGEPAVVFGKNGGKSGWLIDIIIAQRGLGFKDALKVARDWLGLPQPTFAPNAGIQRRAVKQSEPMLPEQERRFISARHLCPIEEGDAVYKYLCEERLIPFEIVKKYRVQKCKWWFRDFNAEVDAIAFPIYSGRGGDAQLLNIKYLAVERVNGRKCCAQEKNGYCSLFGWQAVDENAKDFVICEGEIDAMTLAALGFNALSVPMGAHSDSETGAPNKANMWIQNDWDKLEKPETIKVCMDTDSVGKAASQTICRRLGFERAAPVEIPNPYKDPNEAFCDGLADELKQAVETASPKEPDELAHVVDFSSRLRDRLDGVAETLGRALPWNLGPHWRIRNYELTLVTGYSGHGKTAWLDNLLIMLCHQYDETCCIASQEVPADQTLETMFKQCTGREGYRDNSGRELVGLYDNAVDWLNRHIMFYNKVGRVDLDDILRVFAYCFRRYGTKLFCIDSFMCLGDVSQIDLESQGVAVQKMCDFVMKYGVHLFLVAHSKKPDSKRPESKNPPEKHDINGNVHISDLAHNVVAIWRNIKKDEEIEKWSWQRDYDKLEEAKKAEDAKMLVRKQRNGSGRLPGKRLWFDLKSRQFRDKLDAPIVHIVKPDFDYVEDESDDGDIF